MKKRPTLKLVLPIIVVSQFLCTSLWFAGNAVLVDIAKNYNHETNLLANLTSMVQFGFIAGTLVFAVFAISDYFSPSKVFGICALIAAVFNLGICFENIPIEALMSCRFLTGFMLAGIYPVGMKIASDYYQEGLGKSLGFLVGALVLGTAFPHLIKSLSLSFSWQYVIYATSFLAVIGGLALFIFIPDGPFRKAGQKVNFAHFILGFKNEQFRATAFGYFGHMWELYAFWAFLPLVLNFYRSQNHLSFNVSLLSFMVIGIGSLGCAFGGILSQRLGAKKIATAALCISGICCLLSPIVLTSSMPVVLMFLSIWGLTATADSPLFSSLIAKYSTAETRGTSLTIVNCIGFAITIISIQLLNILSKQINSKYLYMVLAIGPALGLLALIKKSNQKILQNESNFPNYKT